MQDFVSYHGDAEGFTTPQHRVGLVLVTNDFIVEGATFFGILLGVEVDKIHPQDIRRDVRHVVGVTVT